MNYSNIFHITLVLAFLLSSSLSHALDAQAQVEHFKNRFPSAEVKRGEEHFSVRFSAPHALKSATSEAEHPIDIAKQFVLSEMASFNIFNPEQLQLTQFTLADEYGIHQIKFALSFNDFRLEYWSISVKLDTSGDLLYFEAKTWPISEKALSCTTAPNNITRDTAAKIVIDDLKEERARCTRNCFELSRLLLDYQDVNAVEVASIVSQHPPHCHYRTREYYNYDINAETGEIISKQRTINN